ncbi:MAG TPA: hypothetical protein VES59_03755 [Bacteroidota bacterium]|nr:hypothetical protein [Bacteroidota bacterium]
MRNVRLQAVKDDTLTFIHWGNQQESSLGSIIEISRGDEGSRRIRGLVAGAAVGGALGFVLGGIGPSHSRPTFTGGTEVTDNRVAYTIVGVLLGGLLGTGIGGSAGTVRYDLREMKAEEKADAIESVLRTESAGKPAAGPDSLISTGIVPAASTRPHPSMTAHLGLAIPTGDYRDLNGAAAVPGFLIGCDLIIPHTEWIGSLSSITLSVNSVDDAALGSLRETLRKYNLSYNISSWTNLWVFTGLRLSSPLSRDVALFGSGQIGLLFGWTPSIEIRGNGGSGKAESASATSLAYGFGGGLLIADRYALGFRYLHGNPEYRISAGNTTATGKQSTSILQLTAGIRF